MDDIVQELLNRIDAKDVRIKELTDLMLSYTGIIKPDQTVMVPESTSAHPVGMRWSRIRSRLEEMHGKTASRPRFAEQAEEAAKEIEDAS